MRAPFLAILAALVPATALAAPPKLPAGPGEIRMSEISGQTNERTLVEAFVASAKGQPLESVLYDLNGDGNPEVVARLKGPGMCDEAARACRTVAFRKEVAGWVLVFDRPTQRVETRSPGYGGMRDLVVDGRETYAFSPGGYKLDFAASGTVVDLKAATANFSSALATQFGVGAERLALKGKGVSFKVATVAPKPGSPLVMARMEGPGACGRVLGCPWRLLRVKDGAYSVVAEGFAGEKVALLPVARDGWRDIAVQSPGGFTVYGWSGKRYVVAETRKEGSVR
jgi:hypothetical protein